MKRHDAGWLVAEFAVAFVAGAVGAMVTAHRRAEPADGRHDGVATARAARHDLQPAS